MLRNDIHRCKASGIFLRLEGGGLIAGNNIYHNAEAGVDIRKRSNPLVLVLPSACPSSGGSGCSETISGDVHSRVALLVLSVRKASLAFPLPAPRQ